MNKNQSRSKNQVQAMTLAALLCAVGIVIPMVAPKIVLPPASYTLASHVPIFIAMFLSPVTAIAVSLITTLGFLISGFPMIIVLRALTHVIFAAIGAIILKKYSAALQKPLGCIGFGFLVSVIHGIFEVIVVTLFFMGGNVSELYYQRGYLVTVIGFVGVGTIIHSMIDFGISLVVWRTVQNMVTMPVSVRLKTGKS